MSVSSRLLAGVRRRQPIEDCLDVLAEMDAAALEPIRTDRQAALAFWLNVYNAAAQLLLSRRPALFDSRWRFFREPAITVSDTELSLDDIEHGILRGRRSKYGLGYLPRVARSGFDSAYRFDIDPRLHFALNCGAASCPAIFAYEPSTVDQTLDDATKSYLAQTVTYDATKNRVRVPRVCLWFVGDFGGLSGIRVFLERYEQIPPASKPLIRFTAYDWTKAPRQFADSPSEKNTP